MIKYLKLISFSFIIMLLCINHTNALNDTYFINKSGATLNQNEYNEILTRFGEGFLMTASKDLINIALKDKTVIPVDFNKEAKINVTSGYVYPCDDYTSHRDFGDMQACADGVKFSGQNEYLFELFIEWNPSSIPKMVKSFDILAMRWDSNFVATSYVGEQFNSAVVTYGNNGANSNRASNGAGISMNIMNDTTNVLTMKTQLRGSFNSNKTSTINMVYLHANRDVTLEQSKSYTFNSSGLGKVLTFNNSTIRSYYQSPVAMSITVNPQ